MNETPEIAIIIRARNEERWIGHCLRSLKTQTFRNFEVILVDNNSTDHTVRRSRSEWPDIKVINVDRFRPGFAINEGCRASNAPYFVCLSAHCFPANPKWLENMYQTLKDEEKCAGVYGRQVPMNFTTPEDKRDLLITFGLDKRVQHRDPFFHNANSIFSREIWDAFPFDEEVTNIEDRVWAKEVLGAGRTIVYEPEAVVYHYHGIHQSNDPVRARNVIFSMENKGTIDETTYDNPISPDRLDIVTIIPATYSPEGLDLQAIETLLKRAIKTVQKAQFLSDVIVSTDNADIANIAEQAGASISMRPAELSETSVRVNQILQHELHRVEETGRMPDYVLSLEITHPFRHSGLLDQLVVHATETGAETTLAGRKELRPCWYQRKFQFERLDHYQQQREDRDPLYLGLPGLGCLTLAHVIRDGKRFGDVAEIIVTDDPIASIEVRDDESFRQIMNLSTL